MESFYGGRPGTPFIIVKTFSSINEMVTAFSAGNDYTEVYYDEYVMITSPNNATHHGEIYRRGYNFSNAMGGAEYIGTFTGPAGPVSEIDLVSFDNTNASATTGNVTLVPGKYEENNTAQYNDTVAWQYCNIIDNNETNPYRIKIGFKVPYPVFEFEVQPIENDETATVERIDDLTHPFYSKWQFNIPTAIHGDSIRNVKIHLRTENDGVSYINYSNIEAERTQKKHDDIGQLVFIYELVTYDKNGNEKTPSTWYYMADFKMFQNVNITNQGYMQFVLPDGSVVSSDKIVFPQITGASLSEDGTLSFTWTNNPDSENPTTTTIETETKVKWIDDINSTSDGNLEVTWNLTDETVENNDENTRVKETKILNLPKAVTDVFEYDNALYKTYPGIENELGSNYDSLPGGIIRSGDSVYYHYVLGNISIWYKQIADLKSLIEQILIDTGVIDNEAELGEPYTENCRANFSCIIQPSSESGKYRIQVEGIFHPTIEWPDQVFTNRKCTIPLSDLLDTNGFVLDYQVTSDNDTESSAATKLDILYKAVIPGGSASTNSAKKSAIASELTTSTNGATITIQKSGTKGKLIYSYIISNASRTFTTAYTSPFKFTVPVTLKFNTTFEMSSTP